MKLTISELPEPFPVVFEKMTKYIETWCKLTFELNTQSSKPMEFSEFLDVHLTLKY
jgi:hypothetical protein